MPINLLLNAGFETDANNNGIADNWLEEHTTATAATYTRVTDKKVNGSYGQRMQKTGEAGDSNKKVEIYQYTAVGAFAEGETAAFSIWLAGTVSGGTYCQMVIEAHDADNAYIAEVNQVCPLSNNLQEYRLNYANLPAGTSIIVVVVICPEFGASSACDIYMDAASLTKTALDPITRRQNLITHPSFELGTTLPTGWTESNSIIGSVTYELSTTSPGYGNKKLHMSFTAVTTQSAKVVQLISNSSANGTFAPGDTAAASLLIDGTATGCNVSMRIQFLTSVGGSAGTSDSSVFSLSGTPTRISHTAVAPANAVAARVLIRITGINNPDSFDLNIDGVMLENATSAGSYIDGDVTGCEWLGTANASVSREIIPYVTPTVALTGTATGSITETDIVTGGKTIILTLTGDTWVAAGTDFDNIRDDIIAGLDSGQSEAHGWDAEVKPNISVSNVVRTSDTVVTITLDAIAAYNITAQETITATIPAVAIGSGIPLTASPTFTIDQTAGTTDSSSRNAKTRGAVASNAPTLGPTKSAAVNTTLSHTIDPDTDMLVVVAGNHQGTISGITFDGTALTKIAGAATIYNEIAEIWILRNPTITTANIVMTASGGTGRTLIAVNVIGSNDADPTEYQIAANENASATLNITPAEDNELIIAGAYAEPPLTPITGVPLATLQGQSYENASAIYTRQGTAALFAPTFTLDYGGRWALAAIAIKVPATTVTVSDTRPAHTKGQDTATNTRNARAKGIAVTSDTRPARTKGNATTSTTRPARTLGNATATDTRPARTKGTAVTSSTRGGHVTGALGATSTRNARTKAQGIGTDTRLARTHGIDTTTSSRAAHTKGTLGVTTSDTRGGHCVGTGWKAQAPKTWYTENTPELPGKTIKQWYKKY